MAGGSGRQADRLSASNLMELKQKAANSEASLGYMVNDTVSQKGTATFLKGWNKEVGHPLTSGLCHRAKSHHPQLLRDSNVQKPGLTQLTSLSTISELGLPGQGQPPHCPQTARNNKWWLQRRCQARAVRSGPAPCQDGLQDRQTLGHALSSLDCLSGAGFVLEYYKAGDIEATVGSSLSFLVLKESMNPHLREERFHHTFLQLWPLIAHGLNIWHKQRDFQETGSSIR